MNTPLLAAIDYNSSRAVPPAHVSSGTGLKSNNAYLLAAGSYARISNSSVYFVYFRLCRTTRTMRGSNARTIHARTAAGVWFNERARSYAPIKMFLIIRLFARRVQTAPATNSPEIYSILLRTLQAHFIINITNYSSLSDAAASFAFVQPDPDNNTSTISEYMVLWYFYGCFEDSRVNSVWIQCKQ